MTTVTFTHEQALALSAAAEVIMEHAPANVKNSVPHRLLAAAVKALNIAIRTETDALDNNFSDIDDLLNNFYPVSSGSLPPGLLQVLDFLRSKGVEIDPDQPVLEVRSGPNANFDDPGTESLNVLVQDTGNMDETLYLMELVGGALTVTPTTAAALVGNPNPRALRPTCTITEPAAIESILAQLEDEIKDILEQMLVACQLDNVDVYEAEDGYNYLRVWASSGTFDTQLVNEASHE